MYTVLPVGVSYCNLYGIQSSYIFFERKLNEIILIIMQITADILFNCLD